MTKKTSDVTLSTPVTIDGQPVTGIDLRKPKSGELRGLKLSDVLQMDVDALITLLPRITQPPLSSSQVADLDPADLMSFGSKVALFFAAKSELQGLMENS